MTTKKTKHGGARKGAGRKRATSQARTKRISVALTPAEHKAAKELAAKAKQDPGVWLRALMGLDV